jgi:cyclophilin family peptidyl-prolyl cis-trans isomerase
MAVKEKDPAKGATLPGEGGMAAQWMSRLNEFGERHATAIIAASTVLTILTVILFASYFYNRSQNERAEQELSEATTTQNLKALKEKYGSTPVAARIRYALANKYYEDGDLDAAKKEYQEFKSAYPTDPLAERVTAALRSLDGNLKFQQEDRERKLKEPRLQTHPRLLPEVKDNRLGFGPVLLPRPTVEVETATGRVVLELFEDEAPKAVAAFLKLVDEKYFDGIKLDMVNGDERLATVPRADKPAASTPYEPTPRPAESYSLLLVRDADPAKNAGGQFQVLLKELPDLKDVTIFGTVKEGAPLLKGLKKDDIFKAIRVLTRRAPEPVSSPQPDKK